MGFVVKKPGVCTTVQDLGRIGYQGSGFSPSGVMDHRAALIANLLVENKPGDPVLEFAVAGYGCILKAITCRRSSHFNKLRSLVMLITC